jgi:hypothetical protein
LLVALGAAACAAASAAPTEHTYLPAVVEDRTATPTPTPPPTATATPEATCPGSSQLLANTGFEDPTAGWSYGPATWPNGRVNTRPKTGSYSWWSGKGGGESSAQQTFAIPPWAQRAALYFSYYMQSSDSTSDWHDQLWVQVAGGLWAGLSQSWSNSTGTRGSWVDLRLELSSVRSGPAYVTFRAYNAYDNLPTEWWVDDVRVVATCGGTAP